MIVCHWCGIQYDEQVVYHTQFISNMCDEITCGIPNKLVNRYPMISPKRYKCPIEGCTAEFPLEEEVQRHLRTNHSKGQSEIYLKNDAKRDPTTVRYDILVPTFIRAMAQIADYGGKKYGDLNWQKSRLTGDKGPPNHILEHLNKYMLYEPYDHKELGEKRKWHLAAIAFNAMMEWWYEEWLLPKELNEKS